VVTFTLADNQQEDTYTYRIEIIDQFPHNIL
jgi:hypothetical protein